MRIIHFSENALVLKQILFTSFSRKLMENSVENFYVDIGALSVIK